ncbi:MAG TPA: Gfo/Idh/MocA family oxidoreductase [Candidatus Rubrimentiphilum sp.]|nr:Gfo/Idh/MocA family oxidoreductase [Candidatus Rubrimentiphilum sp.]
MATTKRRTVGIAMNGVTGRMGRNQHLIRSIVAIRQDGGVALPDGSILWPEPVLVGRNEAKLRKLADDCGIARVSTDLDAVLADPDVEVYFDALVTAERPQAIRAAIKAGKHVYSEKPIAPDLATAMGLVREAKIAGIKNGVVHDKLFLPGLIKLRRLIDAGFFGRTLSVRGEFGYWVFEGDDQTPQRPSWNYRKEDGGGIMVDMFCHWRYVLDNLFGEVRALSAYGVTHIPKRWDEDGKPYPATADDEAFGTFELEGGVVAQINSSWCVRVHRDELLEFQIDGTQASAVVGLRDVVVQTRGNTPRPVWNPDEPNTIPFREGWLPVSDKETFANAFRVQWELFLKHIALDTPFPWDFLAGAKGVQLAEIALQSWSERRWLDVPKLTA